jgi:hypothetical protein
LRIDKSTKYYKMIMKKRFFSILGGENMQKIHSGGIFLKRVSYGKGEIIRGKRSIITVLSIIGLVLCLIQAASGGDAWAEGSADAQQAVMGTPQFYTPAWEPAPPVFTEEQKSLLENALKNTHLPGPALLQDGAPSGPVLGTASFQSTSQASESFVIRRDANFSSIVPSGFASPVLEPTVVNEGMFVFYTANWFAARSTSAGAAGTWSYINPFTDFPTFCCDQDTAYDPARRALLWYRQGIPDVNGNNIFKLGVSTNGGASFCTYTFAPTDPNATWTNQWWDYPRIALGNNFLYIATNMFNVSNSWTRTVLLRFPLDSLVACVGFNYSYIAVTDRFNFTPVQGASTVMHWASHITSSSMRVYHWREDSGSYTWDDKAIAAWSTALPAHCPTTDGNNPCARSDYRMTSGWLSNWDATGNTAEREPVIGFFWNVAEGFGFTYPYVESALFRMRDTEYIGRPYIWNPTTAFFYADGAPNTRGDMGVVFSHVTSGTLGYAATLNDDYYFGAPPSWTYFQIFNSATGVGPSNNAWGDYQRVHPHNPAGFQWIATGWHIDTAIGNNSRPHYIIFGRERDNKSLNRWLLN